MMKEVQKVGDGWLFPSWESQENRPFLEWSERSTALLTL
jgi:hypothetical protein